MTGQEKLRREIYALGLMIDANASALASKTMNDDDRAALQLQMATRISHLKLLQKRLERLSEGGTSPTGPGGSWPRWPAVR